MRRSLLFIPADTPGMMQHADVFDADAIIFDLEDAVLPDEKDAALTLLDHYLQSFPLAATEIIIRINPMDSPYAARDIKSVVCDQIDTILLPKADLISLKKLDQTISKIESDQHMTKPIKVIALIETPAAVLDAALIAQAPRVDGLLLGGEDLATALEVERTSEGMEIFLARSLIVLAAKAHGIDAIDTPYVNSRDLEGLAADARRARGLGLNAKACIHPNQVETVNVSFSPTPEDIAYAQKIILAQKTHDKGVFAVDGKMVDAPVIKRAERLLEKARHWKLVKP